MYEEDLALNNLQGLLCIKSNQTKSYIFNILWKQDLALDNQQWLIWFKTQPNQTMKDHKIVCL